MACRNAYLSFKANVTELLSPKVSTSYKKSGVNRVSANTPCACRTSLITRRRRLGWTCAAGVPGRPAARQFQRLPAQPERRRVSTLCDGSPPRAYVHIYIECGPRLAGRRRARALSETSGAAEGIPSTTCRTSCSRGPRGPTLGELITVPGNFLVDREWCCETRNFPWV